MKRAEIYQRKSSYFVHASSRTVDGFWILTEPCVELPVTCSDAELGDATMAALDASRAGVPKPPPEHMETGLAPLFRAAGVKSWGSFARGASLVGIRDEDDRITITPNHNREPRNGFRPDTANVVVIDRQPGAVLGGRIREAFTYASRK